MKSKRSRASAASVLSALSGMAVLSVTAGLLLGWLALPVAGMAGIATRDAAETFNDLSVPGLTQLPTRSEILNSQGGLVAYYYPNHVYRVPVSYNQIAPSMREAILAIEDSRFYLHGAIDIRGTMRALALDLMGGPVQGGSTIAQQYVKNALLLTAADSAQQHAAIADSAARKIRELRMAAEVEHELTPDQLLAAYLNAAYFENESYGIEVAAERYFGRPAARLTLTESATLAGLVQNPAEFDPVANPVAARERRNVVLARMAQLGYISGATAAAAERAPLGLHFRPQTLQEGCSSATATQRGLVLRLRDRRAADESRLRGGTWQQLNTTGGLKIYTTMNPQDQAAAQNAVDFMLPAPPSAYNPGQNAAAEVLIQPGTGHVEAIAVDRPYGIRRRPGQHRLRRGHRSERRHRRADRVSVQAVHADHGAQARHPVRFQAADHLAERHRAVLQLPGLADRALPCRQRRRRRARNLLAVHRDDQVDQRVLRRARAARRPVQRRQDSGQHG